MSNPFVAEVRVFPFNFAPKGWAFCDGQILPLSQNTALFSLVGTFYGGDGKSNFALPNMQGNLAVCQGQLAGGSLYDIGQVSGSETVSLLESEMPSHSHTLNSDTKSNANSPSPNLAAISKEINVTLMYTNATAPLVQMNGSALAPSGGDQPHNNMMPYLTLNFCIALQGIYPARG